MTTRKVTILILTIFFFGCSSNENYEIDSLWNIHEHDSDVGTFYHCDECNTESVDCCVYNFNNQLYDRGESYTLDNNGKIDSIYSYRVPLGVNIISVEDQIKLSTLDSLYVNELKNRKIYWNSELNAIVDGKNTYTDFETDADKKYLIVNNDAELKLYKYK